MRVAPIVEGRGEVQAVPLLLRRLAAASGVHVEVVRPIRQPKGKLVKQDELRRAIALAAKQTSVGDSILVLLDADGDCPADFGPRLLAWARTERGDRNVAVVLARREFEAWFLAAADSLVAAGKLAAGTVPPVEPETIADPKGWLSSAMNRRYSETIDQPAFTASFDLEAARQCRSFDKLARAFTAMLSGNG